MVSCNAENLLDTCLASSFILFAVETGTRSFVWFGPSPRLNISDPELIKEILTKTSVFQKPRPDPIGQTIVGGLLFLEDDKWATHRKIINSAFHLEKLKVIIIVQCATFFDTSIYINLIYSSCRKWSQLC